MSYTALAAGPVALLIAVLGIAISLNRLARRATGPGFHGLQRAHGNACEHTPLLLILLFLAETLHSPHWVLVLAAWGIIAARLLHAVGLILARGGTNPLQFVGAGLTYTLEVGLGVSVLLHGIRV
jgi:uncharacterized membrane protein YecN with MAPEG domain